MSQLKSSKIYIQQGNSMFNFMWANVMKDDSVMLGCTQQSKGYLKVLFDENFGELRPPDVLQKISTGPFKITFHKSGKYKMDVETALPGKPYDRCTVLGPCLDDISEPRRMLEVMIAPNQLKQAKSMITEKDIILDATEVKDRPLRCSIFCMSEDAFQKIRETNPKFIDTSEYECSNGLVHGGRAWLFVLRVSRQDNRIPDETIFFLPGEIKWPSNKVGI